MTSLIENAYLGVDVSKNNLDVYDGKSSSQFQNNDKSIEVYLRQFSEPVNFSIEPTNRYHKKFVEIALSKGHHIYLVDPFKVSRYRDAIGIRAKTDTTDAMVLHRYAKSEKNNLNVYTPVPKGVEQLNELLRSRATLAKEKAKINQSLGGIECVKEQLQQVVSSIETGIVDIDIKLASLVKESDYSEDYQRCLAIPGIGPVISTALVAMYHRCEFKKADSFIAFMGMDVRVKESGLFKGKRKLTKRGNPEIRRLLFNGARAGARTPYWNEMYNSLRNRGLSTTASHVAIGRKMARLAYALMRDKSEFIPLK